jgi:flagellar operon protein
VVDPTTRPDGVRPVDGAPLARRPSQLARTGASFGGVLAAKLQSAPLRFSSHALQRIERRNIPIDDSTVARLDDAVKLAASKGARDSLVLVDRTAFVVSVPNRTVITAVDQEHMREQVFTNIDSAVIA